jgi:hypothetical protein
MGLSSVFLLSFVRVVLLVPRLNTRLSCGPLRASQLDHEFLSSISRKCGQHSVFISEAPLVLFFPPQRLEGNLYNQEDTEEKAVNWASLRPELCRIPGAAGLPFNE